MVQTSDLFELLPDNVRSLAFLARLRFYLPNREVNHPDLASLRR